MASEVSIDNQENKNFIQEVLNDFYVCCLSRECSLLGRKEVLSGKAKFGIFGDGKEVAQVAMAKAFRKGDFRSGYYRDQTFMMAIGECTIEDFFAQLYADTKNDIFSGGRQMNSHFATPLIDEEGNYTFHSDRFNVSSDISPTAGQMARSLGLALASKLYKNTEIPNAAQFSINGEEISFCTIGDASTSEGIFWETINAAAVIQVPLAVFVWDDGYGISVPKKLQTSKESISLALSGFKWNDNDENNGLEIYEVMGWDYPQMVQLFEEGIAKSRTSHVPILFHVKEITQPQGHSTSGSHERYKSAERLEWERNFDCIKVMREWIIENELATNEEMDTLQEKAKAEVKEKAKIALDRYSIPQVEQQKELRGLVEAFNAENGLTVSEKLATVLNEKTPQLRDLLTAAHQFLFANYTKIQSKSYKQLHAWILEKNELMRQTYAKHLYSETPKAAAKVTADPATYAPDSPALNGFQILNTYFEQKFNEIPNLIAFGEDVGNIGDVNQGFAGLQSKFGENRIFDTGIREWSIIGQGIGLALRGFRPIAELQYLDYLVYALSALSDDLATLRFRSNGQQAAPLIIRTRGHRLEGIWHTGSPLGLILSSMRGIHVCVPRNMTQAAGMYNTLMVSDDPALVIECLNGYRLKETLPTNLNTFKVPLGVPEVLQQGTDITLVTYGSCIRVAQEAIAMLQNLNISVELIDVQTLLPFDTRNIIRESLAKTNRLIVLDEDVPGGASAYMLQQILEVQNSFGLLDSAPRTIAAAAHRGPYGSEADYFSKPNSEQIVETALAIMHEVCPQKYPSV